MSMVKSENAETLQKCFDSINEEIAYEGMVEAMELMSVGKKY